MSITNPADGVRPEHRLYATNLNDETLVDALTGIVALRYTTGTESEEVASMLLAFREEALKRMESRA